MCVFFVRAVGIGGTETVLAVVVASTSLLFSLLVNTVAPPGPGVAPPSTSSDWSWMSSGSPGCFTAAFSFVFFDLGLCGVFFEMV